MELMLLLKRYAIDEMVPVIEAVDRLDSLVVAQDVRLHLLERCTVVHGGFLKRKILELRFTRAVKEVREGLQHLRFGRERPRRSQSQHARQNSSGHECRSSDFHVPSAPCL